MEKYNKAIGSFGERKAALYLRKKGYKILDTNFFIRGGELDIIAQKDGYIVFVEVKTRQSKNFGTAAEAVAYNKQMRMTKAAQVYLMNKGETNVRFDVIEVYAKPFLGGFRATEINHIENAF